jgi:outer membrane protein assembly factor BamE (lipoprotein component of BamABCDE complex)
MKKKNLLLALALTVSLAGCGTAGGGTSATSSTASTVSSAAASTVTTSESAATSSTASSVASSTTSEKSDGLTADKYNSIKMGSSYDEVVAIIGSEGTIATENEVSGVKSTVYTWTATDGISNLNVTISNGVVVGKAQAGIDNGAVSIDSAKFDAIQTGMTYDQVKEAVGGDGALMSEDEIAGVSSKVYIWYAADGFSNATVSMQNDSVISKSQVGLE